jgi:signal peptidase
MARRRAIIERGLPHYVAVGASAGLLAVTILIAVVTVIVPSIIGATPMTVLTGSMIPTYPPGTLVIVVPTAPETIRIGDPITYQLVSGKPDVVTHRVVAISHTSKAEQLFTLKGDNNAVADALPVIPAQVRGKVAYSVPWVGYLNTFISGSNRSWIVPIVAGGLFVYAGFTIIMAAVGAVRKRRRSA